MTVLVLGASSALGRALSDALEHDSREPVVRASRNEGIRCDVTDPAAIDAVVRTTRPRLVFHLVASYSGDLDTDLRVNAWSARELLDAVARYGLDARVVLIGSAAEYGRVEAADNPIHERQALKPCSVYGFTKAVQTQIGMFHSGCCGVDVVVARVFNLMGAGLPERVFVGRVERLLADYAAGRCDTLEVGPLDAVRDYLSVDDAVGWLRRIAQSGQRGEVYNVGSGQPIEMRALLRQLLDSAGVPYEVVRERRDRASSASHAVAAIYADMSKALSL